MDAILKAAVELAGELLEEANKLQTPPEREKQAALARMLRDPRGKAFTMCMTDQCFRSCSSSRTVDQLVYLLNIFGIPRYLSVVKKIQLGMLQFFGKAFPYLFVPLVKAALRKETSNVILQHIKKQKGEGVRLNLNHLGEAILGEEEAERRCNLYLHDLEDTEIDFISIKISTIFSQINLLSWNKTVQKLSERLKRLYRAAKKTKKFVNLDMEEYRDLRLTVDLFKQLLSQEEFHDFEAGIVLQAYLPEAHEIQKELTTWAIERIKNGGAPIRIRLVKGANLAMEQVEASLRGWPQAPYTNKIDTDANYKRMVAYGSLPDHAKAVHLGIASHNLLDIAYALILRAQYRVEAELSFEMLEGMADHIRRSVQKLSKTILLYCPVVKKDDFHSAIAYLIRRLDENTGPDNFLRAIFDLKPHTPDWEKQVALFTQAHERQDIASLAPRRTQDRNLPPKPIDPRTSFQNEADTDFSLACNRKWIEEIVSTWKNKKVDPHPTMDWPSVNQALTIAKKAEQKWGAISVEKRCDLMTAIAQSLRERRGDFIGVMMTEGKKTPFEADPEVSEAIDFAEYYKRSQIKMNSFKDLAWRPKGTIVVASPWNFPISIPAGGILAALASGNCVLFKPAPEAIFSGWLLANALWDAGVPKEVLHFINCLDDPIGSRLIQDERLDGVILTGATATARLFLNLRPGLDLAAETGGKNAMIITAMSDRDLAIKDLVQSAFGHSGQKCSAASLAILEAEVYDDPNFLRQLQDATESLSIGSVWDLSSKITPLIHEPNRALKRGLTSLDEGERWLVTPKQNSDTLWSPGIKLGVREGSFMHQTELFGPVLAIMRAKNLDHAIHLANAVPYGLTSGLHSLDEREQKRWLEKIEAGNLYINRGITGAIVRRQPFGGCKASSFGPGGKAGGPNYVHQFATPKQIALPQEKCTTACMVDALTDFIKKINLSAEELGIWYASIGSYAFWSKRFHHDHDPSKIVGQDNFFRYRPYHGICLRLYKNDTPLDILRSCAAALTSETPIQISYTPGQIQIAIDSRWRHLMPIFRIVHESETEFLERIQVGAFRRVRLFSPPTADLKKAAAASACHLAYAPVLASGRFELLHYLREIAISIDYHRYGNLGAREGEIRKPLL